MSRRTFPDDALPPEGTYESRETLLAAINSWAKSRGYAFTTGKSSKTSNGRVKVVFACDRNGLPPSTSVGRKRRTSSRGTGCKFSVLAKQSLDGNTWVLSHRPDKECGLHNHPPSEDPSAHPAHRQLEERDITVISSLTTAGTAPREIRTYLRNNSNTIATQQDIYNRIAATRRDMREGQSSIQALVDQLHKEGFWCRVQLDSDNRLTAIFFAHPDSVAYLQCNPDILLLDCTYKTNKHAMPLLDMVGVDSCQRSFCIAFAFLSGESEEDYSWALEHLRSLYQSELPSVILTDRCLAAMNAAAVCFSDSKALLCLWHVNKAVLQRCRPFFAPKGDQATGRAENEAWNEFYAFWHSIVASPNEETFEERLAEFELKYGEKYLEPVGYIKMCWLEPYKEKIVKAWVDKHLHFGNVATSRAEGIHSLMKSHIKTSTFDLFDAWQAMKHAINNQLKELNHVRVSQQIRTPLDVSGVIFEAVRGWVSHHALRKVQEQRQLLLEPLKAPCSQSFTSSYGLPCAHTLKKLEEEHQNLLLEHFHPHWHLKRDAAQPQPILEPRRAPKQAIRSSNQPDTSTRREPSGFETAKTVRRAPFKCSACHQVGHHMRATICPLKYSELLPAYSPAQNAIPVSKTLVDLIAEDTAPSAQAQVESVAPKDIPPSEPTLPLNVPELTRPQKAPATARPLAGPEPTKHISIPSTNPATPGLLQYTSPEAIYARYIAARSAWYAAQPAGRARTDQEYRKAMKLPLKYPKSSYEWCLGYKFMGKICRTGKIPRPWTTEEVMAYLDWSNAEDARVEEVARKDIEANGFGARTRGPGYVWAQVDRDTEEQNRLYG